MIKLNNKGNMLFSAMSIVIFVTITITSLISMMSFSNERLLDSSSTENYEKEVNVTLQHISDTTEYIITNNEVDITKDSIENELISRFPNYELSLNNELLEDNNLTFDIEISINNIVYYQNIQIKNSTPSTTTCEFNFSSVGTWNNSVTYYYGDVIKLSNKYYVAISENKSQNPNTSTSHWILLSDFCINAKEFDYTTQYQKGNLVKYNEKLYISLKNGLYGITPNNDKVNWIQMINTISGIGDGIIQPKTVKLGYAFTQYIPYAKDSLVRYNNKYYITTNIVYDNYLTPDASRFYKELTSINHTNYDITLSDIIYSPNKSYNLYSVFFDSSDKNYKLCTNVNSSSNCTSTNIISEFAYTDGYYSVNFEVAKKFEVGNSYSELDLIYNSEDNHYYIVISNVSNIHSLEEYWARKVIEHGKYLENIEVLKESSMIYKGNLFQYEGDVFLVTEHQYIQPGFVNVIGNKFFKEIPTKIFFDKTEVENDSSASKPPGNPDNDVEDDSDNGELEIIIGEIKKRKTTT